MQELRKRDYVVIAVAGLVAWYVIESGGADWVLLSIIIGGVYLCATLEEEIRGLKKDLAAIIHDGYRI